MKRLALVLAATTLGTGCYVSSGPPQPTYGSVNLYWDFVRSAPAQAGGAVTYDPYPGGSVGTTCSQSAVDHVTVDAPGVAQTSVTCIYAGVQGVGIDGVPSGTQPFHVTGWRSGVAVYEQTFNLVVPVNAAQSYPVHVHGVPDAVDLFAALYTTTGAQYYATCADASNPVIDYDVWDSFGTHILSGSAGCQDPTYPSFPIFVGNLDLDNYTLRMQGFTGPAPGTRVFDSCASNASKYQAFNHFASQTGGGGVLAVLDTPPNCTASP